MDLAIYGLVGILGLAIVLLVGYGITWLIFGRRFYGEETTVKAKVVATAFHPEHNTTNVSPIIGSNGGVSMMVSSQHEDEEDIVLLRSEATGRIKIDNADLLDAVSQGEEVELTYREVYTYWSWDSSKKTFEEYQAVSVKSKSGEVVDL